MKRTLKAVLSVLAALSLTACGSSGTEETDNNTEAQEQTAVREGIIGNDTLGWIDWTEFIGKLHVIKNEEEYISLGSDDGRVTIAMGLVDTEGNDVQLDEAATVVWHRLRDEEGIENIKGAQSSLGGQEALQVYGEKAYEEYDGQILTTVAYIRAIDDGQYVSVIMTAPQQGWKDDDGTLYRPHIYELNEFIKVKYFLEQPE